ncbi:MAG: acyloxyacyl hydrolase [Alphaproteobacteria bacterium]|nr:acyloxyacyl hydrolase [Alphaproteobacteria bacterium]
MSLVRRVLSIAVLALLASPAAAAPLAPTVHSGVTPDLLSFGVGSFDFTDNHSHSDAVDFRVEHRWGLSLLSAASDYFQSWDPYVQLHPVAGLQFTSRGQFFGFGGLALDVPLSYHLVFTPQVVLGAYSPGNGKRLGNAFEVRSGMELAYRFENEMRTSVYLSHISNANTANVNPGANSLGVYLHVPTSAITGIFEK